MDVCRQVLCDAKSPAGRELRRQEILPHGPSPLFALQSESANRIRRMLGRASGMASLSNILTELDNENE